MKDYEIMLANYMLIALLGLLLKVVEGDDWEMGYYIEKQNF